MVLDGKIYAMGGHDGADRLDTVEAYDPQADNWQWMARMPQCLELHAAAAMGGKIYVTGGLSQNNTVYVYDPSTRRPTHGRSWRAWAPLGMPTPPQRWVASSTSSAGTTPALSV